MNVNTFIRDAKYGELQKAIKYVDGGGKVDAKNEVSRANEERYQFKLCVNRII